MKPLKAPDEEASGKAVDPFIRPGPPKSPDPQCIYGNLFTDTQGRMESVFRNLTSLLFWRSC